MADRARDRPIHPSDYEQIFDRLVELAADLVGVAVGMAARATPFPALPAEAAAATAVVDLLPVGLRRRLDRRFGAIRVELVLSLLTSIIGASARTPLSSVVDGALRAVEIPEALASR